MEGRNYIPEKFWGTNWLTVYPYYFKTIAGWF
jgi:hypothetical protein